MRTTSVPSVTPAKNTAVITAADILIAASAAASAASELVISNRGTLNRKKTVAVAKPQKSAKRQRTIISDDDYDDVVVVRPKREFRGPVVAGGADDDVAPVSSRYKSKREVGDSGLDVDQHVMNICLRCLKKHRESWVKTGRCGLSAPCEKEKTSHQRCSSCAAMNKPCEWLSKDIATARLANNLQDARALCRSIINASGADSLPAESDARAGLEWSLDTMFASLSRRDGIKPIRHTVARRNGQEDPQVEVLNELRRLNDNLTDGFQRLFGYLCAGHILGDGAVPPLSLIAGSDTYMSGTLPAKDTIPADRNPDAEDLAGVIEASNAAEDTDDFQDTQEFLEPPCKYYEE
ncbi:hypothetical protein LTR66_015999 [Elasticomyces elasticus]|nr:hypothetical protein LTR66_015999 [Elasticomyces elasticus]KAK5006810.1 hypothetical protein LTR28_006055 [Elasticomyces elasticus]